MQMELKVWSGVMLRTYTGIIWQFLFKRRSKSRKKRKGLFRETEPVLQAAATRSYPSLPIEEVSIPAKLLLFF